ncbi:MAG: hypothetical protein QF755_00810 [Candidatus Peribacteraceae bacterium]|jgi:hypothetical protein|nr:hypothetical protein [Candidatus Peribacteraceae bacterium]HCI04123.1 hypothetical protein [Candidatus Peribacteria bacterium]|tara:strand:+ start:7118 stop:7654 length:537 start_codon:yes stop_codon:yes gene_type:complete
MLTFSLQNSGTVKVVNGGKKLVVFPDKPDPKLDLSLMAHSEEEPGEGVISWPGEYDFDGLSVRGIGHGEGDKVSFVIDVDYVRCAFLASPLEELSDHILELLGDIDVLFLPADDAKLGQKIIDQLDPRALIPLEMKDKDAYSDLLDKCGAKGNSPEKEFKVKGRGGLRAEGREVVVLK